MKFSLRRWALLILLSILPQPSAPVAPSARPIVPAFEPSLAAYPATGRLRKLHTVRPDLIPYPLAIEVYC